MIYFIRITEVIDIDFIVFFFSDLQFSFFQFKALRF